MLDADTTACAVRRLAASLLVTAGALVAFHLGALVKRPNRPRQIFADSLFP